MIEIIKIIKVIRIIKIIKIIKLIMSCMSFLFEGPRSMSHFVRQLVSQLVSQSVSAFLFFKTHVRRPSPARAYTTLVVLVYHSCTEDSFGHNVKISVHLCVYLYLCCHLNVVCLRELQQENTYSFRCYIGGFQGP